MHHQRAANSPVSHAVTPGARLALGLRMVRHEPEAVSATLKSTPGRPVPLPVTRLVSRPSLQVVEGQLVAVKALESDDASAPGDR